MATRTDFKHSTLDTTWQNRADACIAQRALTNSKRPEALIEGVYPTHLTHGKGCFVYDTSGKEYIDFICGLGTNLFGYDNAYIRDAVIKGFTKGPCLSLPSTVEVEAAEKLKEIVPWVDRFKFLKSGSEACNAAIKIARSYHGFSAENQEVQWMWDYEEAVRVSQGQVEKRWGPYSMQNMYSPLSQKRENQGDQEEISAPLREDKKGERSRTPSQPEEVGADKELGARQSLPGREDEVQKRQKALRGLWEKGPGSSRGLFETIRRQVALSISSRIGASRGLILSDGYHGIGDSFVSMTAPHSGVAFDPLILPLTGNEDLIKIAAAVIIEPIDLDASINRINYLKNLRDLCNEGGALLIFDEVITGFRVPGLTASKHMHVEPDLICLGKAIGGGMPISAVGGKANVMDNDEYFVSSTYAGDSASLSAVKTACEIVQTRYDIQNLWDEGQRFLTEFNAISPLIQIKGYPTRGRLEGMPKTKAAFMQEMCKAGVLFGPSWFYNFDLIERRELVLNTVTDVMTRIENRQVRLEGKLPRSPFSFKQREDVNESSESNGKSKRVRRNEKRNHSASPGIRAHI